MAADVALTYTAMGVNIKMVLEDRAATILAEQTGQEILRSFADFNLTEVYLLEKSASEQLAQTLELHSLTTADFNQAHRAADVIINF